MKPEGQGRFSTAIEPCGHWGAWTPPGGWNLYGFWHEKKPAKDGKFRGNSFALPPALIPHGQWISAEFVLKHNTPRAAGWGRGLLDRRPDPGHWKGINWRTTEGLKANAPTLESCITDRWTKNPVNVVSFDNLVIAREYIGPVGPQ